MKILSTLTLALFGAFLAVPAFAGSEAGEDSARHYRSHPDEYDGEKVDVDVAFVTRINGKKAVEGVVFFIAHTFDEENEAPGGGIIVAVLDDDTESFMRKYGTAIERKGKGGVDTKRLRGTFHQMKRGRVYIDESGEAHELILAHIEEDGDFSMPDADVGGIPGAGPGPRGRN